jgi:hypothetical protein
MTEISNLYFADWSVIIYSVDVEVLRGEKYRG